MAIKKQADKRCHNHIFKIGDKILLSAGNIPMPASSGLNSNKPKSRFIGPFALLEQWLPVTF
jgi:hypothetical protein